MPDLHHLENQGWEQMQQLLDQHLPREPKLAPVRPIRPLFVLVAAACMGVLFCMPSLLTDTTYTPPFVMTLTDNPSPKELPNPSRGGFLPQYQQEENTAERPALALIHPSVTSASATNADATTINASHSPAIHSYNSSFITDSGDNSLLAAMASIVSITQLLPSETVNAPTEETLPVRLPIIEFPMPPASTSEKLAALNKQALLSVAVQLNRNLSAKHFTTDNSLYNLPVYPSVSASIHINKYISFSTGISVLASGHFDKQGVSETSTPVSGNGVASTMAVVDKDNVRQAYYWQIPVTMDVAVRRNLAVSSGAGFAFLQKVLVQRESRTTDANANAYVTRTATPVINTLLNRAEVQETPAGKLYNVKSAERRLLFNVQYQLKKFNLGLQYSRALSPSVVFPEHPEMNMRNETLTLSIGFRLFH